MTPIIISPLGHSQNLPQPLIAAPATSTLALSLILLHILLTPDNSSLIAPFPRSAALRSSPPPLAPPSPQSRAPKTNLLVIAAVLNLTQRKLSKSPLTPPSTSPPKPRSRRLPLTLRNHKGLTPLTPTSLRPVRII